MLCCFYVLAISQFAILLYFFFLWLDSPAESRPPHCRGIEITLRHSSGRGIGPLQDFYLTTRNTHNRQTFMPKAGFEPAILASKRRQTQTLDRAATGIDTIALLLCPPQAQPM